MTVDYQSDGSSSAEVEFRKDTYIDITVLAWGQRTTFFLEKPPLKPKITVKPLRLEEEFVKDGLL